MTEHLCHAELQEDLYSALLSQTHAEAAYAQEHEACLRLEYKLTEVRRVRAVSKESTGSRPTSQDPSGAALSPSSAHTDLGDDGNIEHPRWRTHLQVYTNVLETRMETSIHEEVDRRTALEQPLADAYTARHDLERQLQDVNNQLDDEREHRRRLEVMLEENRENRSRLKVALGLMRTKWAGSSAAPAAAAMDAFSNISKLTTSATPTS